MSLKHSACYAFRALPLPDGAFLHSSAAGASRGQFFCRFLRFSCVLGSPLVAFLVQIVVKKVLRKKGAKVSENESCDELQPGTCGSLKQENRQLQIWEDLRNQEGWPGHASRAWRHGGGYDYIIILSYYFIIILIYYYYHIIKVSLYCYITIPYYISISFFLKHASGI